MKLFNRIVGITLCLAFLLSVTSCKEEDEFNFTPRPKKERHDIPLTRSQREIVDNYSNFAFDFFQEVNSLHPERSGINMAVSPLSVSIDLSILANALGDEDFESLLSMMKLDPLTTRNDLNTLSQQLVRELMDVDSQVDLQLANSVWINSVLNVKQSFMANLSQYYDASCMSVEPGTEAETLMNNWIADATQGYVPSIQSWKNHFLFNICNSIYFNGEWTHTFDRNKTKDNDFTSFDGKKSKVPMMMGRNQAKVLQKNDMTIAGIPFGNEAYWMYFILPDNKYESMDKTISKLDYQTWLDYKAMFDSQDIDLYVPRFNFDFQVSADDVVKRMGFNFGKDDKMYLPNMIENEPLLEGKFRVAQSCHIELEENGVIVAASQELKGEWYTALISDKFILDRPFLFLIEEQSTGTILVMGKVVKL